MSRWAPFETFSGGRQGWVSCAAVALTLVSSAYMRHKNRIMTASGGAGIVRFELAATSAAARACMAGWTEAGREAARLQLLADYAFLVGYGLALAIPLASAANEIGMRSWTWLGQTTRVVACLALLASVLDGVENALLLRALRHAGDDSDLGGSPAVTAWCARTKFLLSAIALEFLLLVVVPLVLPPRTILQ